MFDIITVISQPGFHHISSSLHHLSTILSTLAYHSLTVLFLGTHEQLPSGPPILGVLWPPSLLTSEFLRNPKPMSSQKGWEDTFKDHFPGRCGMLQSTPLRGPTSSSAHFRLGIGFDTICHISARGGSLPGPAPPL
ncbi:hypothetical protein DVH24_003488 [Malus domestica]|uniref:Uncharacterized protein n=1 Tax=Malus domestica TaxID=3750 RepID=A0A498IIG3_MALDO|nr:hypothetical protein DVH24_003488 [Malus domestica]